MARLPMPDNEKVRLALLAELNVLDTPPELAFDQLTDLAKIIFNVPIALISLIDERRQWFKSRNGIDLQSTSRDVAFCDVAIRENCVMVVVDASQDDRFRTNALVTGAPHIRFYAGAPVRYKDVSVGTVCIIDHAPRTDFGPTEAAKLEKLAAAVSSVLAMRKDAMANVAIMKAREEVRKTLELVEGIADVGQWSFDVKTGRVDWSDQVFRIHGLPISAQAPDYRDVLSLYSENDASNLRQLVDRAAKTGEGYTFEAQTRRPDGDVRNVVAKAVALRSDDGEVETIHGVFQDVTEFRAAIEQARRSEARYRLLAANMPGMLGYWDSGLYCRFANNAYLEWFGMRPDDLIGVHMKTLLGEDLFALNQPFIRGALAGEKQTFERAITKPGGAVGYTLAQYLPDFGEDGRVQGFYVLVTDITNLKLKEIALSESNAQLVTARQEAEAALEIKAQFLATMSHEIRTPLTTILGYAGLLNGLEDLSEEAAGFVERIGKAGRTLLGLINDVLDVSRLEAGEVRLAPQAVKVDELTQDVVEQFQMQAAVRGLHLTLAYDETLPPWQFVDPIRLMQVLNNIIGNACKFTSNGVISTSMRAVQHPDGARMRVEVTDPGPGLTAEDTRKLFKRFQQLDTGLNRKHGGSGLGLAICVEIIKLMRGDIGVVSSVDTGSTFWFEIPLLAASPAEAKQDIQEIPRRDLKGRHILVVDDHVVNRQMIKALIGPYGAEVAEAANGAEAIALCRDHRFDVVFMDIQMPEIDGVTATRTIRARCPINSRTTIVALTAMTKDQIPVKDPHGLFDRMLVKPLDPKLLHSVLVAIPI